MRHATRFAGALAKTPPNLLLLTNDLFVKTIPVLGNRKLHTQTSMAVKKRALMLNCNTATVLSLQRSHRLPPNQMLLAPNL